MRAWFLSFIALLTAFAFSCFAQSVAAPEAGMLAGSVLDGSTGNPIEKARVVLSRENSSEEAISDLKTAADGHFQFAGIPSGKYRLAITRPGYLSDSSLSPSGALSLAAGQRMDDIVVRLTPQSVIAGTVVQENGDPLSGASISAIRVGHGEEHSGAIAGHAYSNDLGEYRLYGLGPGRYYVTATYNRGRASTYYPHAHSTEDAKALDLSAGKVLTGIDLAIPMDRTDAGPLSGLNLALAEPSSLAGRVINSVSNDPVPGARVFLGENRDNGIPEPKESTLADASGYFSFKNVKPGYYTLSAAHKGYLAAQSWMTSSEEASSDPAATGETKLKDIPVRMTPASVITGKILGEDGEPLPNAIVLAISARFARGRMILTPTGRVYTDDRGEYRLYDLPPGRYYVSAIFRRMNAGRERTALLESSVPLDAGYAPTYYPKATQFSDAMPLNLAPGGTLQGIDVVLSNVTSVRIQGRVLTSNRLQGAETVTVSLTPVDLSALAKYSRHSAEVKASGDFELRSVHPGTYFLTADWINEGVHYSATHTVDVGKSNIEGLLLTLQPARSIRGTVQIEGQQGSKVPPFNVVLRTAGPGAAKMEDTGGVGPDGAFKIENLPPDRYLVGITGLDSNLYLKSAYFNAKNVLESGIDVGGSTDASLDLVLSASGGNIDGVVLQENEQAAAKAQIVLMPEGGSEADGLYRTTTADASGKFSLNGIAPGNYRLLASNDFDSAEEAIVFGRLGEQISIEENGHQTVKLNFVELPHF
ncbi:MAG TPA: carboxypeptidase-like regulatory domain-containing protein [Candidatus Angelobacter sp.]|nr:carboxypeptidase-like regulatory domain-containing protein [Candidatus Angelobacter sp.]